MATKTTKLTARKKRKTTARAKSPSNRPGKAAQKARRSAPKKTARKRTQSRTALRPKGIVEEPVRAVAVYESIETEVYGEPAIEIEDEEAEFGT